MIVTEAISASPWYRTFFGCQVWLIVEMTYLFIIWPRPNVGYCDIFSYFMWEVISTTLKVCTWSIRHYDLPLFFLYWIPLFCRSVGKTAMNEQSSRSHCVFTLRISGVNEVLLAYNLMKVGEYSEYCPQISSWCYCCTYSIVLHCRVQSSRFMEYWISLIWLEVSVFHAVVPQGIV